MSEKKIRITKKKKRKEKKMAKEERQNHGVREGQRGREGCNKK